jgi:type VI secretion system secreted protein VgrG
VKVQFHWDRYGKKDENSSCWVRVSQVHAGSAWGGIDLPRIGEEVVVSFEDGDPDRPVIIGRLYNGQAMPPYALPENQTQSGIKTSASKGGGGFNELRFEDKKNSEEVYFRAEKDLNALIQNDRTMEVGNDQTRKIKHDDTVDIGNNQTIKVGKKLDMDAGDEITLKTGQSKIVMKKDGTIEISGMKITVDSKQFIKLKATQEINLKSSLNLKAEGTLVDVKASAKMSLKAALLDLSANAMAKLKGALTMIG